MQPQNQKRGHCAMKSTILKQEGCPDLAHMFSVLPASPLSQPPLPTVVYSFASDCRWGWAQLGGKQAAAIKGKKASWLVLYVCDSLGTQNSAENCWRFEFPSLRESIQLEALEINIKCVLGRQEWSLVGKSMPNMHRILGSSPTPQN